MSLSSQMVEYLNREGTATPETLAASIPDLNHCGGAERALLLLRLNPQFERIDTGAYSLSEPGDDFLAKESGACYLTQSKWVVCAGGKCDEDIIHAAALQSFKALGKPGVPLANMVKEVTRTTGLSASLVEQTLRMQFLIVNTNIFNRPNQKKDNE